MVAGRSLQVLLLAGVFACGDPAPADGGVSSADPFAVVVDAPEVTDSDHVDPVVLVKAARAGDPIAAGYDPAGVGVYRKNCVTCHGMEGRGDGPAALALHPAPVDLTGPRPETLRGIPGGRPAVVRSGSPGTAMPAWEEVLEEDELVAVMRYVHELRYGPGSVGRCGGTPERDGLPFGPGTCSEGDPLCDCAGMGTGQGTGRQRQ